MTPIIAQCPSCHAQFKIRNRQLLGRKLECGKCQTTFRIEGPAGTTPKKRGAVPAKTKVQEAEVDDPWLDDIPDEGESAFDEFDYEAAPAPVPRRPAKKRTRKSRESAAADAPEGDQNGEQPPKWLMPALVGGGTLLGFAVLAGVVFLVRSAITGGGSVEAPTEFDTYVPKIRSFICEYPHGWKATGAGGAGGKPAWARFENGSVEISIRDSLSGQALGDMARATNNMFSGEPGAKPESPVVSLHENRRIAAEDSMNDYEEGPAEPITTGFGESRISEFTATTTFGGKLRGLRATIWNSNHQLNVICKCSGSQFETLKPAFLQVIESIRPGGG